jgi:hypothetical protein
VIVGTVDELEDLICNRCGGSMRTSDHQIHKTGLTLFGGVELRVAWGYGSRKDLEQHRSHICEKCYDEYVATWKIPPEIAPYHPGITDPLPALQKWWKRSA